jgi:hypothetical protein
LALISCTLNVSSVSLYVATTTCCCIAAALLLTPWHSKHCQQARFSPDAFTCVQAAARSGKPVVVAMIHGGPQDTAAWASLPNVKSILAAWYPGQEGGDAITRLLLGDVSPSGRLPVSFPFDSYTSKVAMGDMDMQSWPGRTYKYLQVCSSAADQMEALAQDQLSSHDLLHRCSEHAWCATCNEACRVVHCTDFMMSANLLFSCLICVGLCRRPD